MLTSRWPTALKRPFIVGALTPLRQGGVHCNCKLHMLLGLLAEPLNTSCLRQGRPGENQPLRSS